MVLAIFTIFICVIAFTVIKWQLEEEHEDEELHIDLARDFEEQIRLIESQFTLGKISAETRDQLLATVEANAYRMAEEHVSRLEQYHENIH